MLSFEICFIWKTDNFQFHVSEVMACRERLMLYNDARSLRITRVKE